MDDLKVGDRVRCVNKKAAHHGQVGTVVEVRPQGFMGFDMAVVFDGSTEQLAFWKRELALDA